MKAILSAALVALSVLAGASLSASAATEQTQPQCPAGYELVGKQCFDSNSGDIVLPN